MDAVPWRRNSERLRFTSSPKELRVREFYFVGGDKHTDVYRALLKAMPKKDEVYNFFMCGDAEFDRVVNERGYDVIINPWKLRACLFNAISEKRDI